MSPAAPVFIYTSETGSYLRAQSWYSDTLPNCNTRKRLVNLSTESNVSLFFSDGSPVAYTRVVETIGENAEGGSVDHRFSYTNDGITSDSPFRLQALILGGAVCRYKIYTILPATYW